MLTSGQLLAERYRLDRRIAVGGMGEVWQAVDVRLDRSVAVKVLKPELCGDAEFLHRFRTEARTTASLNHPGIAAVHDYGETASIPDGPEDTAYLVMELVEGEPLAAILARERRINSEHTLEMLEQAGHALQAAHERGLVHRDVKPGNIMVGPTGTVKLTDFGIAKAADAAPVTRSGMVMGTAHYIAPEQALGGEATPSSDVYSLAVVGYECLMGHRPFLSDNAVTVAMMHIREVATPLPPDVPPGVRAVIEATLVKDPRRRYGGGGEFANAVTSVRAGRPLPTPAAMALPQPPQHQHAVGAYSTGAHPVPSGPVAPPVPPSGVPAPGGQPSGNTYPPGVIPPQQPGPQASAPQGPPAVPPGQPTGHGSRAGLWVLVAVVVVVILVIIGVAATRVLDLSSPAPRRTTPEPAPATLAQQATPRENGGVRFVGLDSTHCLGQNALRHPGVAGESSHGAPPTAQCVSWHADQRHETYRDEVAGDRAARPWAIGSHGLRVGMMGPPWTRIGTTQR